MTAVHSTASSLQVGVSIYVRPGQPSLWENGIAQNCLFLLQLLAQIPEVGRVVLINGSEASDADLQTLALPYDYPVVSTTDALATLDVAIEMGAQFSADWARAFRDRGGCLVGMCVGNNYVIDIERMMFNRPSGFVVSGAPYHAVWTIPEYERSCKPYYEAALRAPVHILPHLWRDDFLRAAERQLPEGRRFGYQPRKRWRLGVFEPNLCMVKTCHVPMLSAEFAYRLDPAAIEVLRVFNALELKAHAGFVAFATSLDLVRHGLASFEGRLPITTALTEHADVVVSHHWENGQNYLYYEALLGGYPLIHNSPYLAGCGYAYTDFDCEEAGLALLRAHQVHDQSLDQYRQQAQAYLRTVDPLHPANVADYRRALLDALGVTP
ncbi:MAG: DUF2827 domain-containing protein [Burkholderiales bacterium]|nr:MAG: DUF2827 domain-containing protein [Burkholderiales bacterium]